MHQPLRGFLVEIEDVLHNIISGKTLNRPKEMNALSTKVVLPFFPPVCTFAPSIFSQVDLTVLWNTKWELMLSCCTFSLYSFLNFPFNVFQVNILIMVSFLGAHCYNAYCILLGGQFNVPKLPNLQLHIVKSTFSHFHFYIAHLTSLHYFYGLPKIFRLPWKKSVDCPLLF